MPEFLRIFSIFHYLIRIASVTTAPLGKNPLSVPEMQDLRFYIIDNFLGQIPYELAIFNTFLFSATRWHLNPNRTKLDIYKITTQWWLPTQ